MYSLQAAELIYVHGYENDIVMSTMEKAMIPHSHFIITPTCKSCEQLCEN